MFALFPSRQVALEIFGFSLHWYGLLYLGSFIIAWVLLPRLQRFRGLQLSEDAWSSVLSAAVIGVIGGGRLGYVLFYEPRMLREPLSILRVWEGGMSSHGGFLGVVIALFIVTRGWKRETVLRLFDTATVPIALGLMLGRIGNFINQELYGTVTSVPWAIAVPGVEGLRHPTQLYAVAKDFLIAGVCFVCLLRDLPRTPGRIGAVFLVLYAALRFTVEFFREQNGYVTPLFGVDLSHGQILTLPILLGALLLWVWPRRSKKG